MQHAFRHSRKLSREPHLALAFMLLAAVFLAAGAVHSWKPDRRVGRPVDSVASGATENLGAAIRAIDAKLAAVEPLGDVGSVVFREPPPPVDDAPAAESAAAATPARVAAEAPKLRLTGIAWMPGNPIAFINGRAVRRRERVGNMEVTEIGELYVRLRDDKGQIETLRLYEQVRE